MKVHISPLHAIEQSFYQMPLPLNRNNDHTLKSENPSRRMPASENCSGSKPFGSSKNAGSPGPLD